ncbi:hypothetical protein [Geofilum rhodophaeum]|uniref:hypothetical protein n=1 Tax=Geofilum rhodophaeum TaxID=1965019 RepID=UPI001314FAD2|nr:hypothetical protein [Geofilum rhodophaeum]
MNDFIKYLGVLLILIGVGVLGWYSIQNPTGNALLIAATLLLVGGLALHIILNRILD